MSSLYDLLNRHEGAGNPSTLFGHAQREGGRFAGTDVSKMTLGQLKEFTRPDGEYGQWVKQELARTGQKPRVSTPLGIGQIVGKTMRATQDALGLDDSTVFDAGTQAKMINHLAKNRLVPGNKAATVAGLRAEWEGFKNVDDDTLWAAVQNEDLGEGPTVAAAEGRSNALRDFSTESLKKSSTFMDVATTLAGGENPFQSMLNRQHNPPRQPMQGMSLPMSPNEVVAARGAGPAGLTLPGMPAASAGNVTGLPPSMRQGGPLSFAGQPPGSAAPTAVSSQNRPPLEFPPTSTPEGGVGQPTDAADAATKTSFMDSIAGFLYPNREDPKDAFKTLLGGFGVGLGQLSAGQAVNLQPFFANIANQKQAAFDSYQSAQQAEIDNQMQAAQLQQSWANTTLAERKAQLEEAKYVNETQGGAFTSDQLSAFSNDPELGFLIPQLTSADPAVRKAATDEVYDIQGKRREQLLEKSPQLGELLRAAATGDISKIAEVADRIGADEQDISTAMDATGMSPTALEQNSAAYKDALENNPPLARAMEKLASANKPEGMTARETANMQFANAKQDEMSQAVNDNRRINAELAQMERATIEMIQNPDVDDKGAFSKLALNVYNGLRFASPETATYLAEQFGFDPNNTERIDNAESMLAMMIARPLVKGQGSVTEGERRTLLDSIANGNLTAETRLEVIEKMKVLNELDAIAARQYDEAMLTTDNFDNARTAYSRVIGDAAEVTSELSRAAQAVVGARHSGDSDVYKRYQNMIADDPIGLWESISPTLTDAQYSMYKSAIPVLDGDRLWIRRNSDNSYDYMMNDTVVNP